jgi:hypothetical protein
VRPSQHPEVPLEGCSENGWGGQGVYFFAGLSIVTFDMGFQVVLRSVFSECRPLPWIDVLGLSASSLAGGLADRTTWPGVHG